jgi:hypothetical protein
MDDGTLQWVNGGTFYLSEWHAKQNGMTADFTARDLLEFMSAIYYDDITAITERSLFDLAEMLLQKAELPLNTDGTVRWVIDESLKTIKTTAPLPEDTLANCLQLIANAAECVLYQDRSGTLRIEKLKGSGTDISYDTDYKIDSFNSYSKSEITLSKPIKQVNLKLYTYKMGEKGFESTTVETTRVLGTVGETITVDNPLITTPLNAISVAWWLATHLGHRVTLDSSWRPDVRLDVLDIVTNENTYSPNRVRMTDITYKYNGSFRATGKGKVITDG